MDRAVRVSTWLNSQFFCKFIQSPGDIPRALPSRTAMEAEIPRRRRQISLIRATSVRRCFARRDWEIMSLVEHFL